MFYEQITAMAQLLMLETSAECWLFVEHLPHQFGVAQIDPNTYIRANWQTIYTCTQYVTDTQTLPATEAYLHVHTMAPFDPTTGNKGQRFIAVFPGLQVLPPCQIQFTAY